ncbi:glycerol-3-phosphate 1-O-acyltransferase PlsY [Mycoplasmopsis glycophila]|uniref:Glycerol-3-phosphate acyltransferase n=1 Tax=Mycoplasmopsis glycophila TaxID=171285 RepID=A0A449AU49_9BACT|nr:glycerol-3-phosphate 1-O-acyltransferase PlsY [Mycoplasmopsis glycophila]VEU70054.1 G3P acyltransferase [Mycoplasmopsis glycophila]
MLISFAICLHLILLGYTLGSLNTSILLSKFWKKQDVRDFHSENAGATNSYRVFGKSFAITVLLIDIAKGYLAVLLGYVFWKHFEGQYNYIPLLAGLACVIGHTFPIFFKFKGGKGVGCAIGVLIALNIVLLPIAALFFFGIIFATRYVSLASVLTALIMIIFVSIPWMSNGILAYTTPQTLPFYANSIVFALCAFFIVFTHRSNIKRLLNKSERKFTF